MPSSGIYASGLFPPGVSKSTVRGRLLSRLEVAKLSAALRSDAGDFYYSSWVSFLDAINSVNKGFYTWATVKFYYSVFYAFRASLALDGVCIFHVDRSAYVLSAKPGASPSSSTQQIDLMDAIDWLIAQREFANYGRARFSEPAAGREFDHVSANGVRKSVNAYIADRSLAYAFDPDHAIVAYPLACVLLIGAQLAGAALAKPSEAEQRFLRDRARDQAGLISGLVEELRRLGLLA
jgi:hypothetical protein